MYGMLQGNQKVASDETNDNCGNHVKGLRI
jgi:hypothetical protein